MTHCARCGHESVDAVCVTCEVVNRSERAAVATDSEICPRLRQQCIAEFGARIMTLEDRIERLKRAVNLLACDLLEEGGRVDFAKYGLQPEDLNEREAEVHRDLTHGRAVRG